MRLIDADALMRQVTEEKREAPNWDYAVGYRDAINRVQCMIGEAPTVAEDKNVPIKQPDPITGLVPCDFCTDTFDQKPLLQENKYEPHTCMTSTISIEENNGKHQIEIDLWDGGNVYAAFEINYCPMCGRKLREDTAE